MTGGIKRLLAALRSACSAKMEIRPRATRLGRIFQPVFRKVANGPKAQNALSNQ